MSEDTFKVPVWDISIRLFHWLLAACIAFLWWSGEIGGNLMLWHGYAGYTVLGLVIYRILWGLIGSPYSRFGAFVRGPSTIIQYIKAFRSNTQEEPLSHNPLGGWMVLMLLTLAAVQATTGLFASDDIMVEGPLYSMISESLSATLTSIHHLNFNLILLCVVLHVAAVVYHSRFRGEPLVPAMLHGKKPAKRGTIILNYASYTKMLVTALLSTLAVTFIVNLPSILG